MDFADSQFMTADEKRKVLRQWKLFVKGGFKKSQFTKNIYEHLHLHCGFIAHYNIHGFYATYFEDPEDTIRFLRHFDRDVDGWRYWIAGDYADINEAMCDVVDRHKASLYRRLKGLSRDRDLVWAEALLKKHDVDIDVRPNS